MNFFQVFFSFRGRAGRAEYAVAYWTAFLLLFIGIFALAGAGALLYVPLAIVYAVCIVWVLVYFWMMLAVVAKRMHDLGRRTQDVFYVFIPLVGFVIVVALMFVKGNPGASAHGAPRGFFARG